MSAPIPDPPGQPGPPASLRDHAPFSARDLVARLPEFADADSAFREGVVTILERSFRASLYKDEGRSLRFCIAVSRGETVLPSEEFLAPPLEASFENLRRLSVAVDPQDSCLHVAVEDDAGATRVRIVGISGRPELTDHPQGDQLLLIDVLDPACLALKGRQGEVRYERDAARVPDGRDVLAHALPAECSAAVERMMLPAGRGATFLLPNGLALSEAAWTRHGERFGEQVHAATRATLADGLVLLIQEIRRLGHGGTLVVTTASEEARLLGRSSDAQRFERRRAWSAEPWNKGMTDYVAWVACRNLGLAGIAMVEGVKASGADLRNWAVDIAHARCEQALAQWRADARRCAWLTQVDGAVVLDALLEPRAFGLKITLDNYERLPGSWRGFLEGRGTRHRAAACIADSLDSALALAVSQDGGVTLFVKSAAGAIVQGVTV